MFDRYIDSRSLAIARSSGTLSSKLLWLTVLCMTTLGCGPPKPELSMPAGAKGKPDLRLKKAIDPPDASGKAVLDELGITDLQASHKSVETDANPKAEKSDPKDEKKGGASATSKSASKENTAYRRPARWLGVDELPYEFWEVQYLGNRPVGYLHRASGPRQLARPGSIASTQKVLFGFRETRSNSTNIPM